MATGIALIANPDLVARLLLGDGLSGAGVAVGRLCGVGLLSLGLACWPNREEVTAQPLRALFAYNLLAGLYLGYLRFGGSFAGTVLVLASGLHVLLALVLARPAFESVTAAEAAR
jgi:hypothetical protein